MMILRIIVFIASMFLSYKHERRERKMYTISKHVQQRYAERIMDKECKSDVAGFINSHANRLY